MAEEIPEVNNTSNLDSSTMTDLQHVHGDSSSLADPKSDEKMSAKLTAENAMQDKKFRKKYKQHEEECRRNGGPSMSVADYVYELEKIRMSQCRKY